MECEEIITTNRKQTGICPVHKKGDMLKFSNYCGITLLSFAYTILSNLLLLRLIPFAKRDLGQYQCEFRHGRSNVDQIFFLRTILGRVLEYQIKTHLLFVDFKSSCYTIEHRKVYEALVKFNMPPNLIRLIKLIMDVICVVRIWGNIYEQFLSEWGMRQGNALACLLFLLALEKVVCDSHIQISGRIFNWILQLLTFANDFDIIGCSQEVVGQSFLELEAPGKKLGLVINGDKLIFSHACFF